MGLTQNIRNSGTICWQLARKRGAWLSGMLLLMVSHTLTAADDSMLEQSFGDFTEELQLANSKKKKGVMLFFEQKDCPFCHRMKTTIFNLPRVQKYFKQNFLLFTVDIQKKEDIKDFQGRATTQQKFFQRISRHRGATPVIAFFDLKGKLVARYTGATSNAEEFMLLGKYVIDKAYQKQSFTAYKRKQRKMKL